MDNHSAETVEPAPASASLAPISERSHHLSFGMLAVEALAGAAIGATAGIVGGPPGMIAGAFLGGAVGAGAGAAVQKDHDRADNEEQLDRDIGVFGGSLGEADPNAPKAERGVFHLASMGISGGGREAPAEGPIQNLDEE
jgi:hypothetical protein